MEQEICVENEPILVGGSGGAVNSVNGMTGDVVLTTSDLANTAGFQTANDVASAIASATSIIESRLDTVDASIDSITALIPSQASASNQLADKGFVNSSVATNTANFVGTFNTVEELEAVQNPTNNDYGFVISTDTAGNVVYNRYKYIASTNTWTFEYALNNSSFTATQWAAIQSGITAALVGKITTNEDAISALRTALLGKQDALTAGTNVQIENNVISATDTTYSDFTGTDGSAAGAHGLVPAPATTDAGKFLKADGTWDTAGGTLYSTLGQNTDGAMTQKAATDMIYPAGHDPATSGANVQIAIGKLRAAVGNSCVAIGPGNGVWATELDTIAIGSGARAAGLQSSALGGNSSASGRGSVVFYGGVATQQGEFNIGVANNTPAGYNLSEYRLLSGVYDGQSAHDAVNLGQLQNAILNGGTTAPTTATVGAVGTLYSYVDTTGTDPVPHLMVCTAVTTDTSVTPNVTTYTWTDLLGGGS